MLGKRSVTADTALRLSRYIGTSPKFWLGIQADYDLDVAEDKLGERLEGEIRPFILTDEKGDYEKFVGIYHAGIHD